MKFKLNTAPLDRSSADCSVIAVFAKGRLSEEGKILDQMSNKYLSKIIKSGDISGKIGQTLLLHHVPNSPFARILLLGCGEEKKLDGKIFSKIIGTTLITLAKGGATNALLTLSRLKVKDREQSWLISKTVQVCEHVLYRYDETKSKKAEKITLKSIAIYAPKNTSSVASNKILQKALNTGKGLAQGIAYARQLGNLPGNICTPSYLAKQAQGLSKTFPSIETKVLTEKQMARLGMGSLLSVSAGSAQEAKLIIMRYQGIKGRGAKDAQSRPHVLVGKGITFDTGGISLKAGGAMDEMKFDMCGAASVMGTMTAVASLKLPINVIGVIASAENMPGSKATKPGDIVTSMSGQTIEVLNTDAEGRLVLCDALTYVERFKPKSVIDIATLTGACLVALGSHATGMLSNHEPLAKQLIDAGREAIDPVWQLPLWDEYQSQLDTNFADIANIGGPKAGTITAACFLSRFAKKFHWAHLDIAGTAWLSGARKGATGRPVALLVEYLSRQKA